ncbi:MAG: molybdopterin oxidoreductase family protein [Candidatus Tectomicrobia bacterium]|nr:molybdopterin oxidoreductase family protein [Candidatus Tectomicrobia bacterium]
MAPYLSSAAAPTVVQRSVCPHDCPDTCALLVQVRDGQVVKVEGDPRHPVTQGFLCAKVNHYPERLTSRDRLLEPQKRVGAKGEGRFARISWDEAVTTIAARFRAAAAEFGPESILPYSYAGNEGVLANMSMDRRFFHRLGASLLDRTICTTAGRAAYNATMGEALSIDPELIPHARLLITWGANPLSTNIHYLPFWQKARENGAFTIDINVHRTRMSDASHLFLQPNPGTDAALALGLMHLIVRDGLHDVEFLRQATVGFEALEVRLKEYPPERTARITGIGVAVLEQVARRYATTRPALIRLGTGLQRQSNGGQTHRAIAVLPALVGAWRDLGGGICGSNAAAAPLNLAALHRPDLMQGRPRTINMVELARVLHEAQPPIAAMFVYNSNPLAVAPNQNRVLAGLRRQDLFLAVHEQMMTETARYADILLPATMMVEHADLYKSYWHPYLMLGEKVVEPPGECKSNMEVFRLLARAMGFDEPAFRDSDEDLIRQALAGTQPRLRGVSLERLRQEGWVKLEIGPTPFAAGAPRTPSGKIELYSAALEGQGRDPLPGYEPPAEGAERTPELIARYPLRLVNSSAKHFCNSSFANLPTMLRKAQRPVLQLNPVDAAARGIADGDLVRVFNDRGECRLYAQVGERTKPGVAMAFKTWWSAHCPEGANINRLTSERLADLGGGATYYTNLVEVERAGAEAS